MNERTDTINDMEKNANGEHVSESEKMTEDLKNDSSAAQNTAATVNEEKNQQENEVEKLKSELTESKDKYLRLYSEFENFRRRTAKERIDMVHSANEQLVKTLLPVADDFERATKALTDQQQKELEGVLLIYNKFKKILDQAGVKEMEAGAGSEFNPDLHEAITQIPAPEEKLKGKVVDVVEKGYLLNEKVIRYAKVVVGK